MQRSSRFSFPFWFLFIYIAQVKSKCQTARWGYLHGVLPQQVLPGRVSPDERGQERQQLLPLRQRAPHRLHFLPLRRRPRRNALRLLRHKEVRPPRLHSHRRHCLRRRLRLRRGSRQRLHAPPQQDPARHRTRLHQPGNARTQSFACAIKFSLAHYTHTHTHTHIHTLALLIHQINKL
jgi:hypothetical protein